MRYVYQIKTSVPYKAGADVDSSCFSNYCKAYDFLFSVGFEPIPGTASFSSPMLWHNGSTEAWINRYLVF